MQNDLFLPAFSLLAKETPTQIRSGLSGLNWYMSVIILEMVRITDKAVMPFIVRYAGKIRTTD